MSPGHPGGLDPGAQVRAPREPSILPLCSRAVMHPSHLFTPLPLPCVATFPCPPSPPWATETEDRQGQRPRRRFPRWGRARMRRAGVRARLRRALGPSQHRELTAIEAHVCSRVNESDSARADRKIKIATNGARGGDNHRLFCQRCTKNRTSASFLQSARVGTRVADASGGDAGREGEMIQRLGNLGAADAEAL